MDQERFDELARKVFDSSSRRRVLGGALAGLFGATAAKVADAAGKGKGKSAHKKGKHKKGKAKGEFTCTAANANNTFCDNVACTPGATGDQQCADVGCGTGPGGSAAAGDCNVVFGDCSGNGQGGNLTTNNACPPGTCCNSTAAGVANPSCVDLVSQETGGVEGLCGDLGGEGVCRKCPAGTHCRPDFVTGVLRCICDVTTCPDGCCISNSATDDDDQCIANGTGKRVSSTNPAFDGEFVCGTGGAFCDDCGSFFSGCCNVAGQCVNGEAALECGSNGVICQNCTDLGPDATCASQTCVGGTTTTTSTTGTTGTTGTTSTSTTTACAGKLCSSGTCCPNNKKCKSGGGCKKKHKKHHHH